MSSGFITEAEIQEKRRVRQEEWEKVRKPEEPQGSVNSISIAWIIESYGDCIISFLEVPEEPIDNRSLYDRLKEQKDRKQEEFEESKKLSKTSAR